MLRKPFKFITNKYFLASAGLLLLLLLSERNSIFDQWQYRKEYNKVKQEAEYYKAEIEKVKTDYNELFGSNKSLEKFAREKYMMKRDNEDVFIIVPEEQKKN